MTFVIYFFAAIGFLLFATFALIVFLWFCAKCLARIQLKRLGRVDISI